MPETITNDQLELDDRFTVLDFWATWCGPCVKIAPDFAQLAEEYPDARFCKIDVDKNSDLTDEYGITAMPTFFVIKGDKVKKFVGARLNKIEEMLEEEFAQD